MRLSEEQRALVLGESGWVGGEVRTQVWPWLLRRLGADHFEQEGYVALCLSARAYDPVGNPGVPFGAYARWHVRRRLWRSAWLAARELTALRSMPTAPNGWQPCDDLADESGPDCDPALAAWCAPGAAALRRRIGWRDRVVLYLRCVEGWSYREVSEVFGVSKQTLQQCEAKARAQIVSARRAATTAGTAARGGAERRPATACERA